MMKSTVAAVMDMTTNIMKNDVNPSIGLPKRNGTGLDGSGYNVLICPARIFAMALVKNHTPIKRHVNLTGESLETIDSPIGDKHNSPNVKIM